MDVVQDVTSAIGSKVDFISNPTPLKCFNGVDYEQMADYIKMHGNMFIDKVLDGHGWNHRPQREHTHRESIHPSAMAETELTTGPTLEDYPAAHRALDERFGFDYQATLGEALYSYVTVRPDIGYIIAALCRFNSSPPDCH